MGSWFQKKRETERKKEQKENWDGCEKEGIKSLQGYSPLCLENNRMKLYFFIVAQIVQPMYSNEPGNLGNLGSIKEIQPERGEDGG